MSSSSRPSSRYAARQAAKRSALLEERAHGMRSAPTRSEALLWQHLRGSRLGVPFRRQVVLGRYIVDFVAPKARDSWSRSTGEYHARRAPADARRDAALARLGYRVLRLSAALVERDVQDAVALVRRALAGE